MMETEKYLGKIKSVSFGIGGYQEAEFGISFELSFNGCSRANSFKGFWDYSMIEWSRHCRWTEEERTKAFADMVKYISGLLKDAKVKMVDELKNIPVEIESEGDSLKGFRILTEVL
jgi:hypothetical protein